MFAGEWSWQEVLVATCLPAVEASVIASVKPTAAGQLENLALLAGTSILSGERHFWSVRMMCKDDCTIERTSRGAPMNGIAHLTIPKR